MNYSKRLTNHINHPIQFANNEVVSNSFPLIVKWSTGKAYVTGYRDIQSNTFKDISFYSDDIGLETGILDAYLILAKGKNLQALQSLSSREVESFLRDENQLPAIADGYWPEFETDLTQVLIEGLCHVLSQDLDESLLHFKVTDLTSRIRYIDALVQQVFFPVIKQFYPFELVSVESEKVVFSWGEIQPPQGVLNFLESYLRRSLSSEKLNLVAEERHKR